MTKKAFIRAKLESVTSERHQYKPYLYSLLPQDVYVEIELDAKDVITDSESLVVLNVDGFKAILSKLADAVDEVHDDYLNKARKAGKYVV